MKWMKDWEMWRMKDENRKMKVKDVRDMRMKAKDGMRKASLRV